MMLVAVGVTDKGVTLSQVTREGVFPVDNPTFLQQALASLLWEKVATDEMPAGNPWSKPSPDLALATLADAMGHSLDSLLLELTRVRKGLQDAQSDNQELRSRISKLEINAASRPNELLYPPRMVT
jgi:hypothetical protein